MMWLLNSVESAREGPRPVAFGPSSTPGASVTSIRHPVVNRETRERLIIIDYHRTNKHYFLTNMQLILNTCVANGII